MFYFIVNANKSINLFQAQLTPFDRTHMLIEWTWPNIGQLAQDFSYLN